MKIGELASFAGCDVQTVRFYEREGLLEAPPRDASGYRSYDERSLAKIRFVRQCRSLDIPLAGSFSRSRLDPSSHAPKSMICSTAISAWWLSASVH